jgi:hypothetical protein
LRKSPQSTPAAVQTGKPLQVRDLKQTYKGTPKTMALYYVDPRLPFFAGAKKRVVFCLTVGL